MKTFYFIFLLFTFSNKFFVDALATSCSGLRHDFEQLKLDLAEMKKELKSMSSDVKECRAEVKDLKEKHEGIKVFYFLYIYAIYHLVPFYFEGFIKIQTFLMQSSHQMS